MSKDLKQALYFHQQNKFKEAENIYLKILNENKNNFDALQLIGALYLQVNNLEKSEKYLLKSYQVNSKNQNILNNLGILYKIKKNFSKSEFYLKRNIKINNFFDSKINLGNIYILTKKYNEALKYFLEIQSNSNDIRVLNGLGWSYYLNGDYSNALKIYEDVFLKNIFFEDLYKNYSLILNKLKKFKDSIKVLNKAIFYNKNNIETLILRADAYLNLNYTEKSEEDLLSAYSLDTKNPSALLALAEFYSREKKFDKIINILKNLDLAKSELAELSSRFLRAKLNCCNWEKLNELIGVLKKHIGNSIPLEPIHIKYCIDDEAIHQKVSKNFWDNKNQIEKINLNFSNKKNTKIKIGYFSPDFGDHAVTHHAIKLFTKYNKHEFEVYCYSSFKRNDQFRENIINNVDGFYDLDNQNNIEILKKLENTNLDIAVDLAGHTQNTLVKFFSYPIAKKKITYLGYPGSIGVKESIDYILCDQNILPKEFQKYYFEKILYTSRCYTDLGSINDLDKLDKKKYGLPTEKLLIGAFNRSDKILPSIFDIWMDTLKINSQAVILFPDYGDVQRENIKKYCKIHKYNFDQIIFLKRLNTREDYLRRLSLIDFSVDTFPYNGHTVSLDNLKCGIPVVTLKGNSYASRVTASLLENLNISNFIANDRDEYKKILSNYLINSEQLLEIKKKLKIEFKKYNENVNYVKDIENIYRSILQK